MGRRIGYQGRLVIDSLKDLNRGDKVSITSWGKRYVPAIVTRVRTYECATIINIKKIEDVRCTKFVGYYTGKIATNELRGDRTILTIDNWGIDMIESVLAEADKRTGVTVRRIEALAAIRTLKDWLFDKREVDHWDELE